MEELLRKAVMNIKTVERRLYLNSKRDPEISRLREIIDDHASSPWRCKMELIKKKRTRSREEEIRIVRPNKPVAIQTSPLAIGSDMKEKIKGASEENRHENIQMSERKQIPPLLGRREKI
jgi:hypothetical protein